MQNPRTTPSLIGPLAAIDGATAAVPGAGILPNPSTSAISADPLLQPGSGRYEFIEELARGGMGIVYRAIDTILGREVAVKVLQERFGSESTAARRFLDEARVTGQLQHPAIPALHDLGVLPDGRPFLAMKLVKGRTLEAILKDRSDPSHDRGRFIGIFEQVCQAVGFAHDHKVIHRDLKPANIMVGGFGEVQVMDWGLAKVMTARGPVQTPRLYTDATVGTEIRTLRDSDGSCTQAGTMLGTPAFMPPEQAGGEVDKVDERADVFGLGAILAVILTGKPPYAGGDSESIRLMAIRGQLGDCIARLDGCGADPELVALCRRCLAVERDGRPQNGEEVAAAVAVLRAAAEERARQAELNRVRSEGERVRAALQAAEQRKRRRMQLVLAATAVGLLTATGFAVALATMWHSAEGAKQEADVQRQKAEEEKRIADGLRNEADLERLKARQYLYFSRVGLASRAWNDAQVHRSGELLEQEREQLPGADLRSFEWHYLWRVHHGQRHVLRGHTEAVRSVAWRPDGKRLASGSRDGTVRVWDAGEPAAPITTLTGHTGDIHGVCWSADGKLLASAATDRTIIIWNAETGKALRTLTGHTGFVVSLAWSRDGARIASGSWDRTVRIWDTRTWEAITCQGHSGNVDAVAFSPDGELLASGAGDRTVRIWHARTGRHGLTIAGHTNGIRGVCWNPDGNRLASASDDRTVRLWAADSGKGLAVLRGHTHDVTRVCFAPDGKILASSSADGTVRLWDETSGKRAMLK